jgi:hypothetical protein
MAIPTQVKQLAVRRPDGRHRTDPLRTHRNTADRARRDRAAGGTPRPGPDAMHVGDLDSPRPGLEEFKVDEDSSKPSSWMADARTGQVLWSTPAGGDNGRGVSGDIWSGSAGAEPWSSLVSGVRNPRGAVVASRKRGPATSWRGGTATLRANSSTAPTSTSTAPPGDTRLLTGAGVHSNNGTVDAVLVRRHPRRLARGSHLADVRQHGPADLLHAVPDQYADHDHPPRHPVPHGPGLAEHCLQPAPRTPAPSSAATCLRHPAPPSRCRTVTELDSGVRFRSGWASRIRWSRSSSARRSAWATAAITSVDMVSP